MAIASAPLFVESAFAQDAVEDRAQKEQELEALKEIREVFRAQPGMDPKTLEEIEKRIAALEEELNPKKEEAPAAEQVRPLEAPSEREQGDFALKAIFDHANAKVKDPPADVEESVNQLLALLDDEDVDTRDAAFAKLVALGNEALRPAWRARKLGGSERRARTRKLLGILVADKPMQSLIAYAARMEVSDLLSALSSDEDTIGLLLSRIKYPLISGHSRAWAILLVNSKSIAQSRSILERFDAMKQGRLLDLYFAMVDEYPNARGEVIKSFVNHIVKNADLEVLLEMADRSAQGTSDASTIVFDRLRQAIEQDALPGLFSSEEREERRIVYLRLAKFENGGENSKDWLKAITNLKVGERNAAFTMVRRNEWRDAIAVLIEKHAEDPSMPDLMTRLATQDEWLKVLGSKGSSRVAVALLPWLPYSQLPFSDQIDVLVRMLQSEDLDLRFEASEALRGYGSPKLCSILKEAFESGNTEVWDSLLVWHSPLFENEFRDRVDARIYSRLDDFRKLEWCVGNSSSKSESRLWDLLESPIRGVASQAAQAILSNPTQARSCLAYAIDRLSGSQLVSELENLIALKDLSIDDVRIELNRLGRNLSPNEDSESDAEESSSALEDSDLKLDDVFSERFQRISEWLRLKICALAHVRHGEKSGDQALADEAERLIPTLNELESVRSLADTETAATSRAKLAKDNPFGVLQQAKVFIEAGHGDCVESALVRTIKLRSLEGALANKDDKGLIELLCMVSLTSKDPEFLTDLILELSRIQNQTMLAPLLEMIASLGHSSRYTEALDACARRMRLNNMRHLALRAAAPALVVDQAFVERMKSAVGEADQSLRDLLALLELRLKTDESTNEIEAAALSLPEAGMQEALALLARMGSRPALDAVLLRAAEQYPSFESRIPTTPYLIGDGFFAKRLGFDTWVRTRFAWKFDTKVQRFRFMGGQE
ncbi:MAG: hypothetical protein KDB07_06070 [Planctomycetes bacterium]|nr:hypothetical protein [Planctomycetota bacterium]